MDRVRRGRKRRLLAQTFCSDGRDETCDDWEARDLADFRDFHSVRRE